VALRSRDMPSQPDPRATMDAILEAAVDGILTIDERGLIESVNRAALAMFGYTRGELVGRNVTFLMPSPYRDEHDGYLQRYLATNEPHIIGSGRDVEGKRKDGSVFPLHLSVGEARLADRRVFTGILHDLTETKALESQLLQSQKMEAVGTLAGGVAHDFNNLLTAILGSAEIALGDAEPGTPIARSLARIELAAKRGAGLTKQLLAFSRRQVTHREPVDLNEAVRSVRELFERMIGEDIEVRLDLDPEASVVDMDPGQFDQVVLNLVANARDAMPRGGKLTLLTRREELDAQAAERLGLAPGSYASLSVCDTGTGIPNEIRHKIFEPFFTSKAEGRGTGLGLATALGILRSHGGAIDVQSSPAGSIFRLVIPRTEMPLAAAQEDVGEANTVGAHVGILLVEDDDLMRQLLVEVLELEGHRVRAAGTTDEALELAASAPVDLLVTDVVMPGLTGFDLAGRIRERGLNPRVLFVSGYTDQILADRGQLGPGDAFLRKPFGNDELVAKVAEVLSTPLSGED